MVERIVRFDTLVSTFIPKIFVDKDWANLFGNFEDPVDELVKVFSGVELKCWVQGKDFIITPNCFAKILHINHPTNVDISPYDDRLAPMTDILHIQGVDHKVSAKGMSIGTMKFWPELKTLTLIMFFNLYSLTNTGFINLGRAQFLCDLIIRASLIFVLTFSRLRRK